MGYRDEVASLRSELEKKQADLDRIVTEKQEQERKKAEIHEEMVLTQSRQREAENNIQRYEKEICRLSEDIVSLKEQCSLKDADLRSTINSLNEIQRQSLGEKSGMRAELM